MKPTSVTEAMLEVPFKLDSLSPAPAPAGMDGVWHSYVIMQGTNRITGLRAGSRNEVSRQLDDMVERLNERRVGKQRKARG